MAPLSRRTFTRRLRRLDDAELAAFVGSVYAARGADVEVDGNEVHVEPRSRTGTATRIRCFSSSRLGLVLRDRTPAAENVDVVVTAREARSARSRPDPDGTRYLGPADLREMLLYAIDRESAETLCQRHLGVALRSESHGSTGTDPTSITFAAVLVIAVIAAVVLVAWWPQVGDRAVSDPEPIEPSAGDANGSTVTETGTDGSEYPPGVDSAGLADPDALADAHHREIGHEPYQILIEGQGNTAPVDPGASRIGVGNGSSQWVSFRQRISVANSTVFRSRITALRETSNGSDRVVYDDYSEGANTYRRYGGSVSPKFVRFSKARRPLHGATARLLRTYVGTENTRVEALASGYLVIRDGAPTALDPALGNYTAVVHVAPSGFIYRVSVRFDVPATNSSPGNASRRAGFELTFSDVGRERVQRPDWYERSRNVTSESDDDERHRTVAESGFRAGVSSLDVVTTGESGSPSNGRLASRPPELAPGDTGKLNSRALDQPRPATTRAAPLVDAV